MPKNNNKKGKQKEVPTAVPAPPAAPPPPPPLATHPPPVMTIDTIEEEDDGSGELANMEANDLNEDSWEQMYDAGDDLNGWASQGPQNSNDDGGWANNDGWETSAPQEQMAPQPPPKDERHGKSQKKQQHQQQHRQLQPQSNTGWGSGGVAWDEKGTAKHQNVKRSQTTQRALEGAAWNTWGHEAGLENGEDTEEIEEDEWSSADDDSWGQPPPPTGWAQQKSTHAPQAHSQGQSVRQSSWQTWGDEARRLPKSQQPYHAANLPPGTGGYFHPQEADRQWSQQQAAMTAKFQQQQEQAYALAQAQHRQPQQQQHPHPQQQQHPHPHQYQHQHQHIQNRAQQEQAYALAQAQRTQQQNRHQPQQEQAYALAHAHSLHQPQQNHNQQQKQAYALAPAHGFLQQPQQQQQQVQDQPRHEGKKSKKNKEDKQPHQSKKEEETRQGNDVWGIGEGWQDLEDDSEDHEMHDEWGRRVHFSPPHAAHAAVPSMVVENFTVNSIPPNKLGLSAYGKPLSSSKTLAYAYHGTAAALESGSSRNYMQDFADMHFVESGGAALIPVAGAFFGRNSRMAKDRFHWMFPSDKDENVASLLAWIDNEQVSNGLGSFGLYKFLQTRERGALIVNANYRPPHSSEAAFDWLTYPELQKSKDRTLQASVASYDPSVKVVVFVFLPSKSGNSLAIWRRRIKIPSGVRLAYQAQITQAIAGLNKDYIVHVDEILPPPSAPPPKPKKRKWWKLWLST